MQIKWSDLQDEDEVFDEDFDQEENEGEPKEKKKATAKPKSNKKLNAAVAKEKNNSSLLTFFTKPATKRAIGVTSDCNADVVSHFLANRHLKFCTNF